MVLAACVAGITDMSHHTPFIHWNRASLYYTQVGLKLEILPMSSSQAAGLQAW
jgi:hypothetical protein